MRIALIAAVSAVAAALGLPPAAHGLPDGTFNPTPCGSCHPANGYDPVPSTPASFSASDGFTNRITLSWSDPTPSRTIYYDVFRSTTNVLPGTAWLTLGPYTYPNAVASRTYDDFTAVQGTTYYYWVRARNAGYTSGYASNPGRRSFPPGLACTPASINRTSVVGNNATSVTLTCENDGEGSLAYTVTDDRTWISVSPGSASGLTAGETQNHTVSFPSSALAVGSYSGQVTVNGGSAGTAAIPVSLTVQEPPDLSCTPVVSVTRLAGALSNAAFSCTNNGGGSVSYTITETPAAPWLTVSPASGSNVNAGQSRNHSLVFDPVLAPGTYTATLHYDAGSAGSGDVSVTLEVQTSVVVLGVGDLLVTDRNNGRVLRVNIENGAVTTFTPRPGVTNFLVAPAGIAFQSAVPLVIDSGTSKLVLIDAETGEQTPHTDGSGPVTFGGNPWGLDISSTFAMSVAPGSQQIYRTYLVYGSPGAAVSGGNPALLSVATGIAAFGYDEFVVAGRSAGLVSVDGGTVSLLASPAYADQVFDVERDGTGYAWTELFAGCSSGALLRSSLGLVSSGGLLRCPTSLAVTSDRSGWTAYVTDVGSLAGGSARVLEIDGAGAQSVLASLPDGAEPTFPAGVAISTVEVIPEPGALAGALAALLALCAMSVRRGSSPRWRSPRRSTRSGPRPDALGHRSRRGRR
jgi:hypothetical protein